MKPVRAVVFIAARNCMQTSPAKTYRINEIFLSLQGEGIRAGTPNFFLRFSGCNLMCRKETEGFDCDTEFQSGVSMTAEEIVNRMRELSTNCAWIILTGGEPTLQIDDALVGFLKNSGYSLAIETNGTREVNPMIDWITVSPKTAEHTLRQKTAHEVKYVRAHGMGIPKSSVKAEYYLISPAWDPEGLSPKNLEWCIALVKENPSWRLSLQQHKLMGIR